MATQGHQCDLEGSWWDTSDGPVQHQSSASGRCRVDTSLILLPCGIPYLCWPVCIIMMVADVLAPDRCQAINNHLHITQHTFQIIATLKTMFKRVWLLRVFNWSIGLAPLITLLGYHCNYRSHACSIHETLNELYHILPFIRLCPGMETAASPWPTHLLPMIRSTSARTALALL